MKSSVLWKPQLPFCSHGSNTWFCQCQSVAQLPPGSEFPVSVRESTAALGFRKVYYKQKTLLNNTPQSFQETSDSLVPFNSLIISAIFSSSNTTCSVFSQITVSYHTFKYSSKILILITLFTSFSIPASSPCPQYTNQQCWNRIVHYTFKWTNV